MLWWIILENIVLIHLPLFLYDPSNSHLNRKIVSIGIVSFLIYFHHTPLRGTCVLHFRLQLLLVSFISQSLLNIFQYNLYYCLLYACSTSTAIFRFISSLKSYSREFLHSRVKHSISHIPVIICPSNFNGGLLY